MVGKVYSIPIRGKADCRDHLHLVVATAGQNNLVIPAFGSDGPELQAALKSFLSVRGCFNYQCSIELDNNKHIRFLGSKTGKLATWFVGRRQILSTSEIEKHPIEGIMDAAGMLKIVECVLLWHETKPDDLAAKFVKMAQLLLGDLKAGKYDPG